MKTPTQNLQAQSRPEQLSTAAQRQTKLPRIDFKLRRANRTLNNEKLLTLLHKDAPKLFELAEVIGKWVWITFKEKQPAEVTSELSELGFHWNKRRQLWQHPCGVFSQGTGRDPREKYRAYFPADVNPNR